jgi:hypothetical protein
MDAFLIGNVDEILRWPAIFGLPVAFWGNFARSAAPAPV